MKKILRNIFFSLFLLSLILSPTKVQALADRESKDMPYNKATCDLRMAERRLWIDHVLWTRSFIVSDLTSLEDKGDVLERLLRN